MPFARSFLSDGTTALRSYIRLLTVFFAELVYIGVRPASSSLWLRGFKGLPGSELKGSEIEVQG